MVLLDSGSSYHVRSKLKDHKEYFIKNEGHISMKVANGQDMPVTYVGWIPQLGNTVISPSSTDEIASVNEIIEEGHDIQFLNKNYRGKTVLGRNAAVCIWNRERNIEIYGYRTKNGHYMLLQEDRKIVMMSQVLCPSLGMRMVNLYSPRSRSNVHIRSDIYTLHIDTHQIKHSPISSIMA